MQRDNKGTGFFFGEGQALDLHSILKDIAKQWLSLVMLTFSAVLLSYAALSAIHPLDYVSTATIAVSNIDEDENFALDISSILTSIMEGDELKNTVLGELGLREFEGTATVARLGESNMVKITVKAPSPYICYKEADLLVRNYISIAEDLSPYIKPVVLDSPRLPEELIEPHENLVYALILGIAVLVIACSVLGFNSYRKQAASESREGDLYLNIDLSARPAQVLRDVFHRFCKKAWLYIGAMTVVGVLCYFAANAVYKPVYTVNAVFTANSTSTLGGNYKGTRNRTTPVLGKSFSYILQSSELKEIAELDLMADNPETEQFPVKIAASPARNTNLITLVVRSEDPQYAYDMRESLLRNYKSVTNLAFGEVNLKRVSESGVPAKPSNKPAGMKAAVLGAFVAFIACLIGITVKK